MQPRKPINRNPTSQLERMSPVHRKMFFCGILMFGMGLLAVSLVVADVQRKASVDEPSGNRTWGSVMEETKVVFEACVARVLKVRETPQLDQLGPTGRMTTQLHPDFCYQTIQFDRMLSRDDPNRIEILDVRVEREFYPEFGKASAFVVIPNLRKQEGEWMYQEILAYFKDKRWPFVVVEPNSEEGKRRAEVYAKSQSPR